MYQKSKILFIITVFQRRVGREQTLCLGLYTTVTERKTDCARMKGLGLELTTQRHDALDFTA